MAKAFTRLGREIAISVKLSGPNPDTNPRLRVAMQNALRVVGDNGSSASDVVKVGIFTTRISEISEINASYLDVLGDLRPARSLVEVSALPRQALVEIEMVARVRGDR